MADFKRELPRMSCEQRRSAHCCILKKGYLEWPGRQSKLRNEREINTSSQVLDQHNDNIKSSHEGLHRRNR
jgi:hypothetical protein